MRQYLRHVWITCSYLITQIPLCDDERHCFDSIQIDVKHEMFVIIHMTCWLEAIGLIRRAFPKTSTIALTTVAIAPYIAATTAINHVIGCVETCFQTDSI